MEIKYKTSLSFLVLIGIAVGCIFLIFQTKLNQPNTQDHIDQYVLDAVYDQYNPEGEKITHVTATKIDHYNLSDTSYFENPVIFLYHDNQAPWKISADYGKSLKGNQHIQLWKNVVLHQDALDDNEETTIRTTAITFNPNKQEAETNQAVTITRPHSIVQSVGLRTNFKTGVSQLSTNARVVYDGQ